jgi:hypothetical protein
MKSEPSEGVKTIHTLSMAGTCMYIQRRDWRQVVIKFEQVGKRLADSVIRIPFQQAEIRMVYQGKHPCTGYSIRQRVDEYS